jgi:hypothetical protein
MRPSALLLAAAFAGPAAAADRYANAEHKFSHLVPPGWRAMTADELKGHTDRVRKYVSDREINFAAGWVPPAGANAFVLVQMEPLPAGHTADEAEKVARRVARQGEEEIRRTLPAVMLAVYPDPTAARPTYRQTVGLPFAVTVAEGLVVGHRGTDRLACVIAGAAGRDALAPFRDDLDLLNDSFRFDDGVSLAEEPVDITDEKVLVTAAGAAGCGGCGFAVWLVARRAGRRRT